MENLNKFNNKTVVSRVLALLICNCLILTSCLASNEEVVTTVSEPTEVVINVLYQNTIPDTIIEETTYIGRIQPDETINVMPKYAGEVLIANYSVGDYVSEGALLLKIDDTEIINSINVAQKGYDATVQSTIQSDGSMLTQAISVDSQVESAQIAYDSAVKALDNFDMNNPVDSVQDTLNDLYYDKRQYEWQIDKLQELIDDLPSGTERDTYVAELNIANMKLYETEYSISYTREQATDLSSTTESSRISLQGQVDSAKLQLDTAIRSKELYYSTTISDTSNVLLAQLDQAQAQLEQTQSQLDNTTVNSPVSGVILEKNISANEMASQSTVAYVISNNSTAVTFGVTQTVAQTLSVGNYIVMEEGRDTYSARIVEIANSIDSSSGLFNIKAIVDLQGRSLLTGVAVKVTAVTDQSTNVPTIPIYALYYDNQDPYVYTIDENNKAKKTFISIGLLGEDVVEVLYGLTETDKVITSWNANLLEGVSVVGEFDGATLEMPTEELEFDLDEETEEESPNVD